MYDLTIENCDFGYTEQAHTYHLGDHLENYEFRHNTLHDSENHGFSWFGYSQSESLPEARARSNKHWNIYRNRFYDNHNRSVGATTIATIHDRNRVGINDLNIEGNWFGPTNGTNNDENTVNVHGAHGLKILDNYFEEVNECISIGKSVVAAAYFAIVPSQFTQIRGNIFYRCFRAEDYDSDMQSIWDGNYFIEVDEPMGAYSRHFPSKFINNFLYNTPRVGNVNPYGHSCLFINSDGFEVTGNTFWEDRLLIDPTVAPDVAEVAGSNSLGARTYYVAFTWESDTGETLVSPEASILIADNKLLEVSIPDYTTNFIPSGTKYINFYVGTATGVYTKQSQIGISWNTKTDSVIWDMVAFSWTEPNTGLIAGASPPVANTTSAVITHGIYELTGISNKIKQPNLYADNMFYGIPKDVAITRNSDTIVIKHDNYVVEDLYTQEDACSTPINIDKLPHDLGNVTGATTISPYQSEVIHATLTGAIVVTLSDAQYEGQEVTLRLIQDAGGGNGVTWPANFKKIGGALIIAQGANEITDIRMRWDGTNYIEMSRSVNLS